MILSHQGLYIYIISYGDLSNRWGYHGENGRYIYINITLCATVLADLNSLRRAAPERISEHVLKKIKNIIIYIYNIIDMSDGVNLT